MRRNRRIAMPLLLALALGAGTSAAGARDQAEPRAAGAAQPPAPAPAPPPFDLKFKGGSIRDYVQTLREIAGGSGRANIVLTPRVEPLVVPALELRGVQVRSALALLEGKYDQPDGGRLMLHVSTMPSGRDSRSVYKIDASDIAGRSHRPATASSVWSLAELIAAGIAPEDVLTAIDAALDLYGDRTPPLHVRFHRETKLLLARGDAEQLQTVERVLEAMAEGGPEHDARVELQTFRRKTQVELQTFRRKTQAAIEDLRRALNARDRDLDALRLELDSIRKALAVGSEGKPR